MQNVSPRVLNQTHQNAQNQIASPIMKPIESLKPYTLELETNPAKFRDWLKRFESFYFASNLQTSRPIIQQTFLRECLSPKLSSLLDSKFTDDLEVISSEGDSCISILKHVMETKNPIQLRRLALFQCRQNIKNLLT